MSPFKRFPSISHVLSHAGASLRRFPYVLASATTGTATAIYLIELGSKAETSQGVKLLLVSALGLPLFFALTTWAERKTWGALVRRLFPLLGVALLALYYLTLPVDIERPLSHLVRFALLAIGLHFLVAFLPYLRAGEVNGFWQYNKSLFIRFLTAAVYSQVLFAGLAIALAAIDHLFGVEIDGDVYGELLCLIAGIFNTWVFVAGVPDDLEAQNLATDYPGGLKVFTQYILLPLVALYFLILIAYETKILATWNWPKGWVSELVLWYSVVGILSLLLLYPLQKRAENRWIVAFDRWFFRAMIPLVAMLFLAIYQRISDYGVTVPRHLVIAMAVGLAVVVLYFVFSRKRDIRVIPIVLCVLAFVAAYGPLSAFSLSQSSQRHRLETFMQKYGILEAGVIQKSTEEIPWEDRREMSSIVSYLCEVHGTDAYRGWFEDSLISRWDTVRTISWQEDVTREMGFQYYPQWRGQGDGDHFNFSTEASAPRALDISAYDYFLEINSTRRGPDDSDFTTTFALADDSCFVQVQRDSALIRIGFGLNRNAAQDTLILDLQPHIVSLIETGLPREIEPDQLTFDLEGSRFAAHVLLENISGDVTDGQVRVLWMRAQILLRKL